MLVQTTGLDGYHREITAKGYRFMRPGIELAPWNARVMEVTDPFGNEIGLIENPHFALVTRDEVA